MSRHYLLDHELWGLGVTGNAALFRGADGALVNAMHGGFGMTHRHAIHRLAMHVIRQTEPAYRPGSQR